MRLDYAPGAILYFKFATVRPSTGAPFALSGGTISVYKDNSTTQSTAGVTLTADFDSVTGLNHVTVDTSADGTFYSTGSSFQLVITAGTVDSVSVAGQVVGEFSLNRTSALRPTTAGRTLAVAATGAVTMGSDSFGTTLVVGNLATFSALTSVASDVTAIKAKTDTIPSWPANFASMSISAGGRVTANTDQLAGQTVTAAAGVTFPASVASPTNITAGTITTVTNLTNAPTSGDFTATMKSSITTAATSSTPTVTLATSQPNYAPAKAGDAMALTSGERTTLAGVIWAALTSGLTTVGSVGKLIVDNLNSAVGSVAAGVWAVGTRTITGGTVSTVSDKTGYSLTQAFPTNFASLAITAGGAVTAGTVSDKTGYSLSQSFPANFATLGINASGHISRVTLVDTTTTNTDMRGTDNAATATALASLVTTVGVAGAGLTALATAASLSTVAGYIDTEVAAIKAKTDNLPADPADASDIAAAFSTVNSTLSTIAAYIDTEVAAIKTKTDGLPADTAATLTTIQGYVDTLETELAKVIKTGESRTIARTGKTDVTFTETRV